MGIKSQEYSFMLKLGNYEDVWMPLSGEMSRMIVVRDPPLSFKQYEQNVCVCVCVCVGVGGVGGTSGTDYSVQEVKQISNDSKVKCFVWERWAHIHAGFASIVLHSYQYLCENFTRTLPPSWEFFKMTNVSYIDCSRMVQVDLTTA
jgi:hypothetical protein